MIYKRIYDGVAYAMLLMRFAIQIKWILGADLWYFTIHANFVNGKMNGQPIECSIYCPIGFHVLEFMRGILHTLHDFQKYIFSRPG